MSEAAEIEIRFGSAIRVVYKNHRGDEERRHIIPRNIWFGESKWHKGKQWFLEVYDLDNALAERSFALKDIKPYQE